MMLLYNMYDICDTVYSIEGNVEFMYGIYSFVYNIIKSVMYIFDTYYIKYIVYSVM